jgi:hypothetical protein
MHIQIAAQYPIEYPSAASIDLAWRLDMRRRVVPVLWDLCDMFHNAAARHEYYPTGDVGYEHFPNWLRSFFGALGAFFYYAAMVLDGRLGVVIADWRFDRECERRKRRK